MTVNKSTVVTAEDAEGLVDSGLSNKSHTLPFAYTASGAIADNDIILLRRVPVDAVIHSVRFNCDDLGTTGDFNFGFYPGPRSGVTIADDSDAVDEDAIATAVDVNAAALSDVELRFETKGLSTSGQTAWELAGLTARPSYGEFYFAITASEATTAAGSLAGTIHFTSV